MKIANPYAIFDRKREEGEEDDQRNNKTAYPKVAKVELSISGAVDDDWIVSDGDVRARCDDLRSAWSRYYSGLNGWKTDWDSREFSREYVRAKPQSPQWGGDEVKIIGLLLKSGCKFKQSWRNILQYAFIGRSEGATSMKWYSLNSKEWYRIRYVGEYIETDEERVRLAKRLAKKMMTSFLEKGAPGRDPHPDADLDRRLRKRGIINDDTSKSERYLQYARYRCILSRSDSD